MQLDDALNDGQAETSAAGLVAVASPEALKNELAFVLGYARPWSKSLAVPFSSTTNSTVVPEAVWLIAFSARFRIARASVALYPDRISLAQQGGVLALYQRERRHCLGRIDDEGIQLRDVEQLAGTLAIPSTSWRKVRPTGSSPRISRRARRIRGAQFVGGVRREVALNPEALFKPVQRVVDGRHKRGHLAGNFFSRQTKTSEVSVRSG